MKGTHRQEGRTWHYAMDDCQGRSFLRTFPLRQILITELGNNEIDEFTWPLACIRKKEGRHENREESAPLQ